MATIHSLPAELVRHMLSLAYSPGDEGSGAGLCSTAVVHSSWRQPSVSLMTEKLTLSSTEESNSAELFIRSGPERVASRMVSLVGCSRNETRAILAKVEPNSVVTLILKSVEELPPAELFGFDSLSGQLVSS